MNGDLNRFYQIGMSFDHKKEETEKYIAKVSLLDLLVKAFTDFI